MTRHGRGSCYVMEDDRQLDEPSRRPFGEDDPYGGDVRAQHPPCRRAC